MKHIKLIITLLFIIASYFICAMIFKYFFHIAYIDVNNLKKLNLDNFSLHSSFILTKSIIFSVIFSAISIVLFGILSLLSYNIFIRLTYNDDIKQYAYLLLKERRNKKTQKNGNESR